MDRRALTVEFLGLPGAGKSTLARRVTTVLRARGLPAEDILARYPAWSSVPLRKLARVLQANVGYTWRSACAIAASGQDSVADLAKVLHNWLFISSLMMNDDAADTLRLFDQGIYQALWSIAYSARVGALSDVATALRVVMPKPDVVVIVRASLHTIQRRLAARPGAQSRLERVVAIPRRFARAEAVLEETEAAIARIAAMSASPRTVVVENDRDGGLDTATAELSEVLACMYLPENPAVAMALSP